MNFNDLNTAQAKAVRAHEGPVLVLAGAGSGKTRVITYRIAYLLQEGLAKPWQILAVTFTNKAAAEMKQRVFKMLKSENRDLYIGTFHAFGARFLRRHAEAFGRNSKFTIYDVDDQERLLRSILKRKMGSTEVRSLMPVVKGFIGKVKNGNESAELLAEISQHQYSHYFNDTYKEYEALLKTNNSFDFDDLISLPCELLQRDSDIRESYRQRFQHVLIDEFQDTNYRQGELARLFTAPSGNITAVGDDDQSIYGWRGAHLGNILQFEQDYKDVRIFRLEQNYRSTQAILNVAHNVIKKNPSRHPKKLWTDRKGGEKPLLIASNDEHEEAGKVVERIEEYSSSDSYKPGDMAILYRTNAQSRPFEDMLRQKHIPYVIVGGLKFYERKEIKDFLGYLRLLVNPNDVVSIQRVINLPPRGIGQKTVENLQNHAKETGCTFYEAIIAAEMDNEIGGRSSGKVAQFGKWIESLRAYANSANMFKVSERLLSESGLLEFYRKEDAEKAQTREDNLSELLNALREYCFNSDHSCLEDLDNFLQEVALVTDIDSWQSEEQTVTLMTLHAAKGLEFPIVFMTGLEDGLFPIQRSIDEPQELEEERRLFYVGTTRAMNLLHLTYARNRMRWGQDLLWQRPSRFLDEIPEKQLNIVGDYFAESSAMTNVTRTSKRDSVIKKKIAELRATHQDEYGELQIGCRVEHFKFGEGIVIQTEGRDSDLRVLVNFDGLGEKLLLASFAKLKVLAD
ncbi:ATP-dependent DNA helicase PcrA [candidate division LCP-89 bacterium B3_LCP]|uniref:DNA 3'-5' helicase n=1 Tax=candidate division LCP-89 bacterium B3_LCP TaxID=2012998 RepID=A0A532UUN5_UNCL8|nr:MAG: ATP-dependent DNA helicase PcrA [candidate division LCP-89 bacterium B3_LCP]